MNSDTQKAKQVPNANQPWMHQYTPRVGGSYTFGERRMVSVILSRPVPTRKKRRMLLALLADTHDNAHSTRAALELLAPHHPAAYLHAGDLVDAQMLTWFAGLGAFHFVFGNNEFDHAAIRAAALAYDLHCYGTVADLTFAGQRVALLHGHDWDLLHKLALSGEYAYVVHGHTHVRRDERVGKTRIINPGALHRAKTRSVALLDVATDELRFLEVPA